VPATATRPSPAGRRRRITRALGLAALAATLLVLGVASIASAAAPTQYWLTASHNNPTTHCYTGYGPGTYTDLSPTAPLGSSTTSFAGSTLFGCTPSFPSGGTIAAGKGSFDVWLTNTGNKTCTTLWFLLHNASPRNAGTTITGTGANGNGGITVPAGTTVPTKFTVAFNVPATTLSPGDQIMWMLDVRTSSGSCSKMTLYYGSTSSPSNLSLPTLVAP
jgi:hypothetical protein